MTRTRAGQIKEQGRVYDHGTISVLTEALREVVARYPSQHVLDNCDDDELSGRRPAPASRYTTIAEVRKWREIIDTYGVTK